MLVAHLSDLHVFSRSPETPQVRADVAERVLRIVADLNALPRPLDLVLVTGDVVDGGSASDYALVRRLLEPLSVPLVLVPGNHDRRETMRTAFADIVPFEDGAFLNSESRVEACTVIGLDTTIPGEVAGELCEARLDWLEGALARAEGTIFVLAHHPPFSAGNEAFDAMSLQRGGERLEAMLRAAKGPVRLLCGHVHQAMHGCFAGHYAAIGGSPAFTYDLGLDGEAEPPLIEAPYAYALHHRRRDGTFGVHPRTVQFG